MRQAPRRGRGHIRVATAASGLAVLTCGILLAVASLTAAGTALALGEGVWAAAIAVFAVAAFAATLIGHRRHGHIGPAIAAGAGAALVLWALFGHYDWRAELAGYTGLALAAVWQWRLAPHQHEGE